LIVDEARGLRETRPKTHRNTLRQKRQAYDPRIQRSNVLPGPVKRFRICGKHHSPTGRDSCSSGRYKFSKPRL
jgi:hypothetical protein